MKNFKIILFLLLLGIGQIEIFAEQYWGYIVKGSLRTFSCKNIVYGLNTWPPLGLAT